MILRSFLRLSLGIHSQFLIFLIYAVVFECLSLLCLAPQRVKYEKWRVEGGKGVVDFLKTNIYIFTDFRVRKGNISDENH